MNKQQIEQSKKNFYDDCLKIEGEKLRNKASSSLSGSFYSMYSEHNYPDMYEVVKARKTHKCLNLNCKTEIKKDGFYFRRSFGRIWTIKACSIKCFLEELFASTSGG